MNNKEINTELIEAFRDKVNGNSGFVLNKYRNINGKNHWNLICSCMDWITVAIVHLQHNEFNTKNIDVMPMQVYTYISAIDIIYESINQLDRAICRSNKIPFHGNRSIFTKNTICNDDNEYFKQLRAVFGAHPVNLNDKNGKWFASWPNPPFSDSKYDFELLLYSDEVDKEDIFWVEV